MLKLLAPLMLLLLLASMACTIDQAQLVEGILQNVDSANGEITIVTKDGKTVTLTMSTEAPVDTNGTSSAIETLVPGASVAVEVNKDGKVANRIEARQSKVEGAILEINGNDVTLEAKDGRKITVQVSGLSRIELAGDAPGTLADLQIGADVEIKFDPDSNVALKIDTEGEEAEVDGVITTISGGEVTIETERGRKLVLVVGANTRIELDGISTGTLSDLLVGMEIDVNFDPATRTVFKIERGEEAEAVEAEEVKIGETKGSVVSIEGNVITLTTENGGQATINVADTTGIKLENDSPATLLDLVAGTEIEVKFDQATNTALTIEVGH